MRETIARFRDVLAARMTLLEEEARLAEAQVQEKKGDYRHLALENAAILERYIHDIERLKEHFQAVDIDQFDSVGEFAEFVLHHLQDLYDKRPFIRPAVRMVMACVHDMRRAAQGP
jgi:hypothetical protein